jgi:hypothetical protein
MFTKLSILIALVAWANFDDRTAQVEVSVGTVNIRLRELDTPHVAFSLLQPGRYRIQVSEHGDATLVTVRDGAGEATASGGSFAVQANERVRISGSAQQPQPGEAPPADTFDNCCVDRGPREERSVSAGYVSRDVPGYQDLDDHGVWRNVPGYDEMWTSSLSPRMTSPRIR